MTPTNPETLPAPVKPKHTGAILPLGVNDLQPKNFNELKMLCLELAKSDIVPKDFINKPANILVAVSFGREVGLPWAQALQNIAVINGRPCMWGDAVGGKVMSSGVFEAQKDEFNEATMTASFSVKRVGQAWITRTFSKADAEKADLWKKQGPWQTYPKRMLFNRARAWAYRDAFPDVLKGLRIAEEERDVAYVETTAEAVPATEAPRRASEPAPEPATQPAAEPTMSNEPKKTQVRFEKVQRIKNEARWRAIGKDGVDYMLGVESFAIAINEAIKKDALVDVEYEDGIGCREVFTLLVPNA